MAFVVIVDSVRREGSDETCFVVLKKTEDGLLIRMYIKYDVLKPVKGDMFEFEFEEVPYATTLNNLESVLSHNYDVYLCGTIYYLLENSTYISNGGLLFSINRILGPLDKKYFTKIKKL